MFNAIWARKCSEKIVSVKIFQFTQFTFHSLFVCVTVVSAHLNTRACLLSKCISCMVISTVPSAVISETPLVSSTTINITVSVPSGTVVTRFEVTWLRFTLSGYYGGYNTIYETGDFPNSYLISGLEPGNNYEIWVELYSAFNYISSSNYIIVTTLETGKRVESNPVLIGYVSLHSSQCWSSLTLNCYCHLQ